MNIPINKEITSYLFMKNKCPWDQNVPLHEIDEKNKVPVGLL